MSFFDKIEYFQNNNHSYYWIALLILAWLLLCFCIFYFKMKRPWLKCILHTILLVFVFFLANPISQKSKKSPRQLILLNNNFSQNQLDDLLAENPASTVLKFHPEWNASSDSISSLMEIGDSIKTYSQIQILGDAFVIEEPIINKIEESGTAINYRPGKDQAGIISFQQKQNVSIEEIFSCQGSIKNPGKEKLKLRFYDQRQKPIDFEVPADSVSNFHFKSETFEAAGQYNFRLALLSQEDSVFSVLKNESVAVNVLPANQLKVQILSAAPNFEQKNLKKHLASLGIALTIKTKISRDNFNEEFFNKEQKKVFQINKKDLSQLDLLILDAQTCSTLNPSEIKALIQSCSNGLGLLLNVDSQNDFNSIPNKLKDRLFRFEINSSNPSSNKIQLKGDKIDLSLPEISISSSFRNKSLLKNEADQIYCASRNFGLGKVCLNLLSSTYPLLLKSEKNQYTDLWKTVLQETKRTDFENEMWEIENSPVCEHEETKLLLKGNPKTGTACIFKDSVCNEIYLAQNPLIPEIWRAKHWFDDYGWHTISSSKTIDSPNKTHHNKFYVHPKNSWMALKQEKTKNQLIKTLDQISASTKTHKSNNSEKKPLPLWIPLLGILLTLPIIWIEEKL